MTEERRFGPLVFIPGNNRGKYPFCNSVYVEGPGVLIDPASDRARLERLRDESGVSEVWLSHWHEDHFMHLDLFEDLPFRVSEIETEPLSNIDSFLDWYGMDEPEPRKWWTRILESQFNYRPREPESVFTAGETIELGEVTVEVIHAPGHTPGSLAFHFREPAAAYTGDYDLTPFGPWYGDRDSSIQDTIESVKKLRELPVSVWLTGHESGVFESSRHEAWDRYLEVIGARQQKLEAFMTRPRTLEEVAAQWIVYRKPREPREFFEFGERGIMKKHLERMVEQGRLEKDGPLYVPV